MLTLLRSPTQMQLAWPQFIQILATNYSSDPSFLIPEARGAYGNPAPHYSSMDTKVHKRGREVHREADGKAGEAVYSHSLQTP